MNIKALPAFRKLEKQIVELQIAYFLKCVTGSGLDPLPNFVCARYACTLIPFRPEHN